MSNIIVTGGASGLGRAIYAELLANRHCTFLYDLKYGYDVCSPEVTPHFEDRPLDVLINCAGVNHIDWMMNVKESDWDRMFDTNVKGMFFMSQAYLPALLRSKGTIINIVSNAAHVPMRCSAAYNASKAAALMLTKQMARELSPDITVFSVSPNKLCGTEMSASIDAQVQNTRCWTKEKAVEYQLQGLLTGEETPPKAVAELIAFLLSSKERHRYLTGCDIPYGA